MTHEENELLNKFADRHNRAGEIIELLHEYWNQRDLPDDVNDPRSSEDCTTVNWFANKIEDLALELSELGENMKVGALMEKAWDEKPENCYKDIEEKRQDHGVHPRDFA